MVIDFIKIIYYIVFVCVLCSYMSRTTIRVEYEYPSQKTTLFCLLKERVDQINKQPPWLYLTFAIYCLSSVAKIFDVSGFVLFLLAGIFFGSGVVISLVYRRIKKSPIVVVYNQDNEEDLLIRVKNLERLYNTSKYMIFGALLLLFS